jgi:hypothetical protein
MERQELIELVGKSDLLKRQEGGPGQDGETGVDLVSESDLLRRQEGCLNPDGKTGVDLVGKSDSLKRQEGGPGQDGETGVDLVSLSMLGKSALEGERIWLYQQSLYNKTSVFAYLI